MTTWPPFTPHPDPAEHKRHQILDAMGTQAFARLFPGVQQFPAGAIATAAGLRADPAMRHMGMPLALIAAALADGRAGPQQQPGGAGVKLRRAAEDPGGGGADIGAVQAQPDAFDHLGQVLLTQVSVGVGDAGLSAVAGRFDGGGQQADIDGRGRG